MPLEILTDVFARINNIKKYLFFEEGTTLKFIAKGNELLLEVEENFYIQKDSTSNLAIGEEYFEGNICDLDDEIDLEEIIKFTDRVEVGENKYKISQVFRPRGLIKRWNLRLTSYGKK